MKRLRKPKKKKKRLRDTDLVLGPVPGQRITRKRWKELRAAYDKAHPRA